MERRKQRGLLNQSVDMVSDEAVLFGSELSERLPKIDDKNLLEMQAGLVRLIQLLRNPDELDAYLKSQCCSLNN